MLKRETVLSGAKHPGTELEVIHSRAGFYLGFRSKDGSIYTRETAYLTRVKAYQLLDNMRR